MNKNKEFTKSLINIEDLPIELQEKIQQHYDEQLMLEKYRTQIEEAKELGKQNPGTNIVINNNNRYYITNNTRVLKNDGTINEKQDGILDIFARAAGKAAGKTWKWLGERPE